METREVVVELARKVSQSGLRCVVTDGCRGRLFGWVRCLVSDSQLASLLPW